FTIGCGFDSVEAGAGDATGAGVGSCRGSAAATVLRTFVTAPESVALSAPPPVLPARLTTQLAAPLKRTTERLAPASCRAFLMSGTMTAPKPHWCRSVCVAHASSVTTTISWMVFRFPIGLPLGLYIRCDLATSVIGQQGSRT